jgi:hypothetical protein
VTSRLDGPRGKVERAKKHLHDLEPAIRAFLGTNPYVIGTKRDAETRRLIYYMVSVREPPPTVLGIAGDVLQNLRSALDHLAYQLVLVGTGKPGPFEHVYFPIFDSASEYKAKKGRKVKGMRKEAIDAIDAAKPYKGGNDTLWMLHSLNIVDKHRLLIAVGSAFKGVNIAALAGRAFSDLPDIQVPAFWLRPQDRMCPLKAGDEIFADLPDAEPDENVQFAFGVAFSEPKISECEPMLETLQQMADLVDGLLTAFVPLL